MALKKSQRVCGDLFRFFQRHTGTPWWLMNISSMRPAAAGSNSSGSPAGLRGKVTAMSNIGTSLPPAQFKLTLSFGSEELIPTERFFKAFALENLSIDPNKAILPLRFPMDVSMDPTVEQYWQVRTDWETPFDEDHQYLMLMSSWCTARFGSTDFVHSRRSWSPSRDQDGSLQSS